MCGRFDININKRELIETFDIDDFQLPAFSPLADIPPTTNIPFIYKKGSERLLSSGIWGLIPAWAKDKSFASNTFNARSETLTEKPSFKKAYQSQRCLIPSSGYYEWQKMRVNGKVSARQPYWIGQHDKSLFAFAGLYEYWTDRSNGEIVKSCSVITRSAYPKIEHIHPRMPVILPTECYDSWLSAELNDFPMIAENALDFHPIRSASNARHDNYELPF